MLVRHSASFMKRFSNFFDISSRDQNARRRATTDRQSNKWLTTWLVQPEMAQSSQLYILQISKN
jgi:hypothetical protein